MDTAMMLRTKNRRGGLWGYPEQDSSSWTWIHPGERNMLAINLRKGWNVEMIGNSFLINGNDDRKQKKVFVVVITSSFFCHKAQHKPCTFVTSFFIHSSHTIIWAWTSFSDLVLRQAYYRLFPETKICLNLIQMLKI
jgi:hypothetical protein